MIREFRQRMHKEIIEGKGEEKREKRVSPFEFIEMTAEIFGIARQ